EWIQRMLGRIRELWGQWKLVQRLTFMGIVVTVIVGAILLTVVSAAPSQVAILNQSIADPERLSQIASRLDSEGVVYTITADNRIVVDDQRTAQRMRSILAREDLLPDGTDPWALFDIDRFTITEFERNVNLQRSLTNQIEQHITALDDVDAASVALVLPEDELFLEQQDPVTASVIITPKPGSDIQTNRRKIEGIERLIQLGIPGLQLENITIADLSGVQLNNFADLAAFDRLDQTERELSIITDQEQKYRRAILTSLSEIYPSRIQVVNINVEMNMGLRTEETEEFFPVTVTPDNPRTPFDETETVLSIRRSSEAIGIEQQGTGFNPEGPPGVEGQVPPAYSDLEGIVGTYRQDVTRDNFEINSRRTTEEKSPEIERVTASVALDGVWNWVYDDNGDVMLRPDGGIVREYTPVSPEQLAIATELVRHAIGFDELRGDAVTVQHAQFDRSRQFLEEDARERRRRQTQLIVLYVLIGIAVLLISFIVVRLIQREAERRRRLREEELARQHQAMREAALRSAEEESAEVEMSVEERARMELEEMAINMAREHPEDVAQLIRTWMQEE
ncbi:MAG: flagellar M-ring protein FliF, partial [Cytophagales bacterium]|nr:flagellar M-ring protein FliF [Cytophagales bacterium]